MGQFRETHRAVTIANAASERVWDEPCSMPFRNLNIAISSYSHPVTAANIAWQLFLGGNWTGGSPYDYGTTTHSGGVALTASAPLSAGTTVAHVVYNNTTVVFPANRPNPSLKFNPLVYGFPVVLELSNTTGASVDLYVTFISETVGTNV